MEHISKTLILELILTKKQDKTVYLSTLDVPI